MTAAHPYPHVAQPLDIGPVRLRNRIVRAASGAGIARGVVNDDLVAYHRARAEGGVALTILGDGGVHRTANGCFELWRDDFVDGYRRLADECRAQGMVLFQELSHQGSAAVTGEPAWAPSPLANAMTGEIPRSMTQAMIDEVVEAFAEAAARCQQAGLEGVEVHAAHGFLAGQFLSPSTNIREDAYGGDLEGRSRFLRELLAATRHAVGPGFPVGVRLSATELVAGGITVDETCEVVELLQAEDLVDFVDISVGTLATYPTIIGGLHEPHGYQLTEARPVARVCRVPTIVTGRIHTLAEAERILAGGTADLVSMVRPTIADAHLVAKSLTGREAEVRPCIACNECLRSMLGPLRRIGCAVAPAVGAGDVEAFERAATPRSVLVAGGGPAGMEAARVAAERGHRVVLCEAEESLGGAVGVARRAPHRDDIGAVTDWLGRELDRLGVDVRLKTRVDRALVHELGPDVVVVATGAVESRAGRQVARGADPVPGADRPHVWTAGEAHLLDLPEVGTAVVLDEDGRYAAVGAAERLAVAGLSVAVVSRFSEVASRLAATQEQGPAVARLAGLGVVFLGHTVLDDIDEDVVTVRSLADGQSRTFDADLVVLAAGSEPDDALAAALEGWPGEQVVIGDARAPRSIGAAIAEGRRAGMQV